MRTLAWVISISVNDLNLILKNVKFIINFFPFKDHHVKCCAGHLEVAGNCMGIKTN
jgi:hypothetical protein